MWPFKRAQKPARDIPVFLTNTLSGKKEVFVPLKPGTVTLYSCGPTVYSQAHIGNLRSYVFSDTLARVLKQAGHNVVRVINITDVGHLTGDNEGDANQGEDRIEKSARETGEKAVDIADRYTRLFIEDIQKLGIDTAHVRFPHATQYIPEQIALIQTLERKGHVYRLRDGLYFDTSTYPGYGKLGNIPHDLIKNGTVDSVRERVALAGRARIKENAEKRNPADFALWKFSPVGVVRQQEWQSPWGRGFPGWHIECSAMSKALLGETIDIHTGGIDHIPVHHNNEIAQSEGANDRTLARYWLHGAFLTVDEERIGKSVGNAVYIQELIEAGYHPLALRYFFLQANYRSPLSFSWDALAASQEALTRLWKLVEDARRDSKGVSQHSTVLDHFLTLVRDDLATPKALAYLWEVVKDEHLSSKAVWGVIEAADQVLGLSLLHPPKIRIESIPPDIQKLADERVTARNDRDYARADELRIHIENRGYHVDDTPSGQVVRVRAR